jgi:cytidylate kinase
MVVAIDGPAGSGKSTVASAVARRMGFLYLNSGLFYRSISRVVLDSGRDPEDTGAVIELASACHFELRGDDLQVNGRPAGDTQTAEIDRWSAMHSRIPEVRDVVNSQLRRIAGTKDSVVEGRDIGSVVFPEADVKIYLDASLEARADRRFRQGRSELTPEQIRRRLGERDTMDRNKPVGRLEVPPGAVYIDTSDLTMDQVCEKVVKEIHEKKPNQAGEHDKV